ncbi:hypothetical protein [Gorillibacterium massiliense]|uniref:hypothetical protein n=1 Tax=Gorillibacterium massiliense TaxID=1280390 RepID=UPI0004BCC43F|nr:hypothetical protein [Gorillibacterium massiliense]
MEINVGPITNWLESCVGRTLNITKEETGDEDRIKLQLDKVVVSVRNESHPDDYVAEHSILLQGQGTMYGGEEVAPLPRNVYEIPYDETITHENDDTGIRISTDRAVYRIECE